MHWNSRQDLPLQRPFSITWQGSPFDAAQAPPGTGHMTGYIFSVQKVNQPGSVSPSLVGNWPALPAKRHNATGSKKNFIVGFGLFTIES